MTWDATKSPGDLITSSDWNDMVTDQKNHSSRHSDGGGDELDAADLAGGAGTSGQLLQTDGSAASWVDFQSGSDVSDDGTLVVAAPTDVNYANALNVTDDGDGSVTVDVESDSIQTDEIDLSINPTWSGSHTFNNAIDKPQDSGASTLANMSVSSTPAQGTEQSIGISIDGNRIFKAYAEADGAGGIQDSALDMSTNKIQNVGLIDGVDITSHASRHSDGGSDELDAADLAGAQGTDGQVLTSDGSAASWEDQSSGGGGGGADQQVEDTNKVLQQTLRFGAEGSKTISTSYSVIPDSDIALDFDTFKNGSGEVFAKVKYHLFNDSQHGVEASSSGTEVALESNVNGLSYYNGQVFVLETGNITVLDYPSLERVETVDISADFSGTGVGIGVVGTDGQGSIIVGDTGDSLLKYDSDFNLNSSYDVSGNTNITLQTGIAVSEGIRDDAGLNGTVAVLEADNDIDIYDRFGTFQSSNSTGVSITEDIHGLMYDSSRQEFYVGFSDSGNALAFDTSFNRVTSSDFDVGGQLGTQEKRLAYIDDVKRYLAADKNFSDSELFFEYFADDGTADARIYRQNDGTAVTGTEVTGSNSRQWEILESGFVDLSTESGNESYQIQLKANQGQAVYNSAVLQIYTTQ